MRFHEEIKGLFGIAVAAVLGGCGGGGGGGGSAGIPGGPSVAAVPNDVVAVGRIDAFGSVFVNGVEFETNSTGFRVDDRSASDDSSLAVGMIVHIRGTDDGNGHGTAHEIRYDDEIEGLVVGSSVDAADDTLKHFTVFGLPVVASSVSTVFRNSSPAAAYTWDDLSDGDHIEVSGDFAGDTLIASFIKLEDDNDFEAKGIVSSLNGSTFVLTLRGGATLDVTIAAGASLPSASLVDGAFVEVEGTIPDAAAPQALLAQRVEIEDQRDLDGDGDRDSSDMNARNVDIEGLLSVDGGTWSVRNVELSFGSGAQYRPATLAAAISDGSAAGMRVRVRGNVVNGVLEVERIRVDGAADGVGNLEAKGFVENVTSNGDGTTTIRVGFAPADGTVDVVVNSETLLMDDDGMVGFELASLSPGVSFVEIHGFLDAGQFVAATLHREDRPREYEIEGPLDADGFVAGVSISVMGVTFMLDGNTFFKDGEPSAGNHVDVEDTDRDGFADLVDIED